MRVSWFVVVALLALAVLLMARPIREESATMDEPLFLATGYSYCHGYGFGFDPEQPPLAKMISAEPLWFMKVSLPLEAQLLLQRRIGVPMTQTWSGKIGAVTSLFPEGRDNWYYWPYWDGDRLGNVFLYGGFNDADKLLSAGRWMQVLLMLVTGLVIVSWLSKLSGPEAALFGLALWVFNPLALAYGHLVLTDMGVALMILMAVCTLGWFLKNPTPRLAIVCGLAFGGALLMKFTALVLVPIFVVLAVVHWFVRRPAPGCLKKMLLIPFSAWLLILLVYTPFWAPAPLTSTSEAFRIGVPAWFRVLRPILVPPDFFKGLAMQMGHALSGHMAYFHGQWSSTGWWYYFPVALAIKTPLPLVVLALVGFILWVSRCRSATFEQSMPWIAASVFFLLAMTSTIDIGVRYLLPMIPLLTVGIASQIALLRRWVRIASWLCCAWLVVVTWCAYPHFIEYFNECVGGPTNGYKWLVDSNYDWGQDIKRLKQYVNEHGDQAIYLHYFGPPSALDYYQIPCQLVASEDAHAITNGTLVVSVMAIMRPDWAWLRVEKPVDRIGYTLFVYQFGDGKPQSDAQAQP